MEARDIKGVEGPSAPHGDQRTANQRKIDKGPKGTQKIGAKGQERRMGGWRAKKKGEGRSRGRATRVRNHIFLNFLRGTNKPHKQDQNQDSE